MLSEKVHITSWVKVNFLLMTWSITSDLIIWTQPRAVYLVLLTLELCSPASHSFMLTNISFFFFFFKFWEHVASIVFLAISSHFNLKKGEEERWECQRGSTWQLRVINHRHGSERDGRMKDVSATDMAGISLLRWDESKYSSAVTLLLSSRWYHFLPSAEANSDVELSPGPQTNISVKSVLQKSQITTPAREWRESRGTSFFLPTFHTLLHCGQLLNTNQTHEIMILYYSGHPANL